jgi:DNA-directed RNA polymerase specialized sigma24 family protein
VEILSILAKDNNKWVSIVCNMGADEDLARDIVQDMYVRVAEMKNPDKILYSETEVNYFYVFLTLRSIFIDHTRQNKPTMDLDDYVAAHEEPDMDEQEAFDRLYNAIIAEINGFGKYGSILSQMYFKTNYSMRDLSAMSDISLMSIYNSIKQYRSRLAEKFGEDWEDYTNRDFDKI